MRKINEIIIHCTATPAGRNVSIGEIDRWHRARGFNGIGYHFVIALDGTVIKGRDITLAGAHCKGHNANSIGVCYVGGCDASMNPADTRTSAQRTALQRFIRHLRDLYPEATVHGHNEYAAKACPCFNVRDEFP